MRTANILWRTGARAGYAARVCTPVVGNDLLELQSVLPIIAEIVTIPDRIRSVGQMSRNRNFPTSQARPLVRHLIVRDADSLGAAGLRIDDDEFVQVIVLPAHRVLNCYVKIPK